MAHRESDQIIDEDNPEWTAEDFARARPAREVLPPALYKKLVDNFNKQQALKLDLLKEKIPA